ncbi:flagellar export protein FliJ [Sporolactobacillus kofuensis]|uniref:Flagellar FliJ protein n=1 Tax=Sporolactobacillus kofuensis TaxID=269672 RepID=A0ABW1WDA8_9BACL|nr:flagellar export protein FliJ [Sporolactobacillus kofuensis]MCO7174691.1 flagellar export protein FliJ [Sporolactobacillus kofuensis]
MAFEYRFERVMKLAENEKQNLEVQYKYLFDAFEKLAHRLIDLVEQKNRVQTDLQNQMNQAITIDQMKMGMSDVNKIDFLIEETNKQYLRAKLQLETFQGKLQQKAIEVKKYEKIKEKQQLIFNKVVHKTEMKQMDEIAGQRTFQS